MPAIDRRAFLLSTSLAAALGTTASILADSSQPQSLSRGRRQTKPQLNTAISRIEALGKDHLGVHPAEGRFFHLLARLTRARNVLEIGGCFGLGSLWLALALEPSKGRLTTIEILPDRAAKARELIASFGFSRRTTILDGDAHQIVPTLKDRFDLVICNADKSGTLDYFQKLARRSFASSATLAINGVVRAPETLRPVVEAIAAHSDFDATALQVMPEDGFLVATRRES